MIGLSHGEQRVEIAVGQSVRMFRVGCSLKRSTTLMKRILISGNSSRSSAVAASASCVGMSPAEAMTRSGSHTLIVAGPFPDADALGAVRDGGVHVQVLKMQLLVGDDHIDVVLAPQAVVGHREQAIHIGRKINAGHRRALVQNHVQETGILVREAVVILPPNRRGDQQVQRGDLLTPGQVVADREPFRVLVEHGVDDVDKGFVGGEKAVSPGKQVAFEHALHGVLAEHLDHASVGCQFAAVLVFGEVVGDPEFLRAS